MINKVEKFRKEKLEEYQIEKISFILDKMQHNQIKFDKETRNSEDEIERIKEMKVLPEPNEGYRVYYNN